MVYRNEQWKIEREKKDIMSLQIQKNKYERIHKTKIGEKSNCILATRTWQELGKHHSNTQKQNQQTIWDAKKKSTYNRSIQTNRPVAVMLLSSFKVHFTFFPSRCCTNSFESIDEDDDVVVGVPVDMLMYKYEYCYVSVKILVPVGSKYERCWHDDNKNVKDTIKHGDDFRFVLRELSRVSWKYHKHS
jgi:hypothetical protein